MKDDTTARETVALQQFVGESDWTTMVRERIRQVAKHRYSVLVSGPSGTGKELIARAVHTCSNRSNHPIVPVNCAAIPSGLFSSQLFGHVKGAFTGAQYASLGCFRAADGGTIFLDEIGELDLDCQAKLLRVLQERMVTPVGGADEVPIDVRTVAATNRDLAADVRAGRFRLDLYYRLNVISMESKGLAERREDILPLATHFLAKTSLECGAELKQLSESAINLLQSYDWPGNVRELENFIERAVVFSDGEFIGPEAFEEIFPGSRPPWPEHGALPGREPAQPLRSLAPPPSFEAESGDAHFVEIEHWPTLGDVEAAHVRKTLRETFFNQSAAARMLGIDRKSLARKIKKYGIELPKPGAINRLPK